MRLFGRLNAGGLPHLSENVPRLDGVAHLDGDVLVQIGIVRGVTAVVAQDNRHAEAFVLIDGIDAAVGRRLYLVAQRRAEIDALMRPPVAGRGVVGEEIGGKGVDGFSLYRRLYLQISVPGRRFLILRLRRLISLRCGHIGSPGQTFLKLNLGAALL